MATLVNKQGIKAIHALLARIGMANDKDYKRNLVAQYTNSRETSTTALYAAEAEELIGDLQKMTGWTPEQIKANEKRRLIIHYARQMSWEKVMCKCGNAAMCRCRVVADMDRIDAWCVKYGQFHKGLNEHSTGELSLLIKQFEKVYLSFLKGV